jgi:preprotein translocase subunit SecE
VARNRKRAKERRNRRPAGGAAAQPGVATARTQRAEQTPDPLEHATPDVEIAEAQMALGRPELAGEPVSEDRRGAGDHQPEPPALPFEARGDGEEGPDGEDDSDVEDDSNVEDDSDLEDDSDAGDNFDAGDELESGEEPDAGGEHGPDPGLAGGRGGASGSELATSGPALPGRGNRLVTFLQGSWRELQRVQWPDRRQVMQATGVVIGFVIVAGVFLGAADFLAGKLVNFILK